MLLVVAACSIFCIGLGKKKTYKLIGYLICWSSPTGGVRKL